MTSQFCTIFRSEDSMKSIWFLVTPPGASHVQYLFAALKKSEFVTTRLFSSAKSSSLSPLSFVLPVPKGPVHFILSFVFLTPILALKSPTGILKSNNSALCLHNECKFQAEYQLARTNSTYYMAANSPEPRKEGREGRCRPLLNTVLAPQPLTGWNEVLIFHRPGLQYIYHHHTGSSLLASCLLWLLHVSSLTTFSFHKRWLLAAFPGCYMYLLL